MTQKLVFTDMELDLFQPDSPTTFGKTFCLFARLEFDYCQVCDPDNRKGNTDWQSIGSAYMAPSHSDSPALLLRDLGFI